MNDAVADGVVAVRRGPIGGIAVSADGRRLLVTNYGDDSVSVLDTGSGTVVDTVAPVSAPFAIGTGRRGGAETVGLAYVATASTSCDSVVVIDTDTAEVIARYPVALSIADLVVDPTGQRAYVARSGESGADLLVVDAARGPTRSVAVSATPGAAAVCVQISPSGHRLYVGVHRPDGDIVAVLDADLRLVDTVEVSSAIRNIAVGPAGDVVFVAGWHRYLGDVLEVVDAGTNVVTGRIPVAGPLTQLTLSRDGERGYLVTAGGVVVLCTATHEVIRTVGVTGSPSCAVESLDGQHLYIGGYDGVVTTVPVPASAVSLLDQLALDAAVKKLLELEPAL